MRWPGTERERTSSKSLLERLGPAYLAQEFDWVQNTARNAGAIGVFYWEPTWYAVPGNGWDPANINGTGNGWDNMALFDWFGRVNPGVRWTP